MHVFSFKGIAATLLLTILASGCATTQKPYDYAAFKQSHPRSILVLPPLNNSPEILAPYGMLSQVTYPLAESGYYVFPVALVNETFKQNGLTSPGDIHQVSPAKLHSIFGADTALYITVTKYGSSYKVIHSTTEVSADAKLLDLKTGALLWEGSATASSTENQNSGGSLLGTLVSAALKQVMNHLNDASFDIAAITSQRLLNAESPNGILYGPRSPKYESD